MIATKPSASYIARAAFMAVLCLGFCIWGAYDLWVTIPNRAQRAAQRFSELKTRLDELETARQAGAARGEQPSPEQVVEYQRVNNELALIAPGGKVPSPSSKFDSAVQWVYIACGPFAIMPILTLLRVRRQRYQLDESDALHFEGDPALGSATWSAADIADIDMRRWMAKSIAWVVHRGGARLKLDAYMHSDLDRIVGAIAARLHPDDWQPDARPVKKAEAGDGEGGAAMSENVAEAGVRASQSDATP